VIGGLMGKTTKLKKHIGDKLNRVYKENSREILPEFNYSSVISGIDTYTVRKLYREYNSFKKLKNIVDPRDIYYCKITLPLSGRTIQRTSSESEYDALIKADKVLDQYILEKEY
jgi:hypothetical protein